jgi:hypothetical protein
MSCASVAPREGLAVTPVSPTAQPLSCDDGSANWSTDERPVRSPRSYSPSASDEPSTTPLTPRASAGPTFARFIDQLLSIIGTT